MKLQFSIFISWVIVVGASLSTWAQPESSPVHVFNGKEVHAFERVRIKNIREESLGRIMDLDIDLLNGRIVGMLLAFENSQVVSPEIVTMLPHALNSSQLNADCRLNVSIDVIKAARAVDPSKWFDSFRGELAGAACRILGQEPCFLDEADRAGKSANRRKLLFDSVERSSRVVRLLVGNLRNQQSGEVYAMTLDIPKGRIRSFVVLESDNTEACRIIPAIDYCSSATWDEMVLHENKLAYVDKPR